MEKLLLFVLNLEEDHTANAMINRKIFKKVFFHLRSIPMHIQFSLCGKFISLSIHEVESVDTAQEEEGAS